MSVIKFKHRGSFNHMERFLNKMQKQSYLNVLDRYGQMGMIALQENTPKDSGKTAQCWTYEIEKTEDRTSIYWINTNENKGVNIAIILQYGHGTGTGGYVQGRDYINPAMRPVFDQIAEQAWEEVRSS